MSFHFRDGMWLTQEPPCRLMIWTWFHLFIKDDGLRILSGMYNHIVIAVHFQKSTVCVCLFLCPLSLLSLEPWRNGRGETACLTLFIRGGVYNPLFKG